MAELSELAHFLDLMLPVEATLPGPSLSVGELLTLGVGSLVPASRPAGETIDLFVGDAFIGSGEWGSADGRQVLRMVRFKGAD